MSDKKLVLITGGTGHIGYAVIVKALDAGYRVRAAVRSLSKGESILNAPSIKALPKDSRPELVHVPDMTAPGAYDEAMQGVTYAIHVASPLATAYKEGDDLEKTIITPAVTGTLNILTAASKVASVKRIVITSSIAAIIEFAKMMSSDDKTVYNASSRAPLTSEYTHQFPAYSSSKAKALHEAEEYVKREKPGFDIVHILPSFVLGPDELTASAADAIRGSNFVVLGPLVTGQSAGAMPGCSVHVSDVAAMHVKALDSSKVPGNQGYIATSDGIDGIEWEDVQAIVKKTFKEAVENGRLNAGDNFATTKKKVDAGNAEEVFEFKFKGFEEQITDAVQWYLSLVEKDKTNA